MGWRNVWILTGAQALAMCGGPMIVLAGGIIGVRLAPLESLSTLPVALYIVGVALGTVPVATLMQRFSRKLIFIVTAVAGIGACLLTAWFLSLHNFWGYCLGITLLGFSMSAVLQYRFAAMESVSENERPLAASRLLLGGIVAAVLGPELAVWGKSWTAVDYEGAFYILGLVYVAVIFLLLFFQEKKIETNEIAKGGRPLSEIMRQPVFWVAVLSATVGYAVMSFIMTATPVSMHVMDGHQLESTKTVIQSHILAMYLPSLITGWLIQKFKAVKLILTGLGFYGSCVVAGIVDHSFLHYWLALVLLGIGWNFLFTSGTSLLPSSYREEEKFKVQALNDFMVFGSQALASICSGWILYLLGWNGLLVFTLPFILVLLVLVLFWSVKGFGRS